MNPRIRPLSLLKTRFERVGVLIGTGQQDVAIMAALFLAKPPFDDIRNVSLRLIVSFGSHVLVCRTDFAARTLTCWRRRWLSTMHYPRPPVPLRELSRRTEDRAPF
jgi:hypothetical protein